MKRLLNPTIALITFILGLAAASAWHVIWHTTSDAPQSCPSTKAKLFTQPVLSDAEIERYAVYSALIRDMYIEDGIKLLVFEQGDSCQTGPKAVEPTDEKTEEPTNEEMKELRRRTEEWAYKQMPSLQPETIKDFHRTIKECFTLDRKLDIPIKYVFAGRKDLSKVFPEGEVDRAWRRFYSKYPKSSGIINVSNVGFNPEMNQALVYAGRHCGGLCGSGNLVFLAKENGQWKVAKSVMTWVS